MFSVFRCASTFGIPSRGLFVFAGDVVEGTVRVGMNVLVPMDAVVTIPHPIVSVEHINTEVPRSSLGLVVRPENERSLQALAALGMANRDLRVVPAGRATDSRAC